MLSSKDNTTLVILNPGRYDVDSCEIEDCPKEILYIESGLVEIFPLNGNSFFWNATAGMKIKLVVKKILISSGLFCAFFVAYNGDAQGSVEELSYLIDESGNNFVDESGNKFIMI